ncbi:MAG: hypothetical protein OEM38_01945 [Gammaproteobacteria bacterium]|nr:hypothetical protein [Gammaproteobacteria bacterium]
MSLMQLLKTKLLKSNFLIINFCVALLLLVTFSSTTRSNTFLLETYVGVINIHHKAPQMLTSTITGTGIYLLHVDTKTKPLKLLFKHGQPDEPIMSGDKVQVVGLNAAGRFFVEKIETLPNNSLPF